MTQSKSTPNSSKEPSGSSSGSTSGPLEILRAPAPAESADASASATQVVVAAPVSAGAASEAPSTKPEDAKAQEYKDQARERGEFGGPKGPEPTRYGDWELKGRCVDF